MNSYITERDVMADVPNEKAFKLNDGKSISSLAELYSTLKSLDEEAFSHHVKKDKHDFGNWVKDVHKDYRLANELFTAKCKDDCTRAVGKRMYEIQKDQEKQQSRIIQIPVPKEKSLLPALVEKAETANKPESTPTEKMKKRLEAEQRLRTTLCLPSIKKEKNETVLKPVHPKQCIAPGETAAERLEKILSEAAKGNFPKSSSIDEKERTIKARPKPVPGEKEPHAKMVEDIMKGKIPPPERSVYNTEYKPEPAEPEPIVLPAKECNSNECDELIQIAESKGFTGEMVSEVKSIFSGSTMKVFANDMKKIFSAEEGTTESAPSTNEPSVNSTSNKKEEILSQLKKVYK
ncbi:hypothetical protein HQ545_01775 [Candidatus Woesearchaeota archaeon]|nr:hypothetical protein [Candidatus Woesearchaeota archaeon]